MKPRNWIEYLVEYGFVHLSGFIGLGILFLIFIFLVTEGLPLFWEYPLGDLLTGTKWYPLSDRYGAVPLINGTLLVTLVAALISIPLSVSLAIFISELCPPRLARFLKVTVEILAAIPSVVFGFIGIMLLGPGLEKLLGIDSGLNALTAGMLLAFMALPTIASVAEESLRAVPDSLREASLALGAGKLITIWKIVFPAALPGIFAGVMLGIGRVVGETMTVMMVTGGSARLTMNPLESVRTLTGTIAAEMGEVSPGENHYHALFVLGLILFLITIIINTTSSYFRRLIEKRHGQQD